jgi:DNA-binding CsgD family transcriptional regulator
LGSNIAVLCNRAHLTRPPADAIVFQNLPHDWAEHYAERRYHQISGAFAAAQRGAAPFFWSEHQFLAGLTREQILVLNEARDFGICDGFTWPLIVPGASVAVCSLVADPGCRGDRAAYAMGGMMAIYAHERARALIAPAADRHLSHRERQCLTLAATGKSDWAIGEILNLSHSTVHNTLERAKARLGVATRIQAVVSAIELGEIVLGR